jgi:hypothetical protein
MAVSVIFDLLFIHLQVVSVRITCAYATPVCDFHS